MYINYPIKIEKKEKVLNEFGMCIEFEVKDASGKTTAIFYDQILAQGFISMCNAIYEANNKNN